MFSKVIIAIGKNIEDMDTGFIKGHYHLEVFPELNKRSRLPQHANATLAGINQLILGDTCHELDTLFIVTHSSVVANRIGAMIEEGHLSYKEVEIWMYDNHASQFWTSKYFFDEMGFMQDWPYGWFDADI